ncbi:class I SAM-dependent methyltransferase [Enhygromyxa salina]|uniref:Demethylmenaquinone methyltransferase n=1 Tax=Enhygromyxa salina TaxID=215803 RepID=A0A2S9YKF7_9BACT|nr:methyltransferase domain-containing protein [Enhygromyxa salina]PRQ05590.1 Demethylmenaquinone methyltransferase [Enhygromyxa salina]
MDPRVPPLMPVVPVREGYDQWAPHYDEYDNAVIALEQPISTRLIGEVAGARVLDVGCGTGRHALRMVEQGAEVTGVDFSTGMLDVLRAKLRHPEALTLIEHDISGGLPTPDQGFDLVLCCLVLEHLPRLDLMLAELARVCRPGGRVVIADFHPEMFRRGLHARFRPGANAEKLQIQGIDHTISDYVMATLGAGLTIVEIAEHLMDADTAARSPSASKYIGEPMLLTLACRRTS